MAALNLRDALSEELALRAHAAPGYSLRKFAADLEVSPAQLSKVLSGKSTLSEEKIAKISGILKWSAELTKRAIIQARSVKGRRQISFLNKQAQYTLLSDANKEGFKVISEWHHSAILELLYVKGFTPDTKYVAERLNIEIEVAQSAIHRLIDLKMLRINDDGTWEDISKEISNLKSFDTQLATQHCQLKILEKAQEALKNTDSSICSQIGSTFSVPKSKIAEATQIIIEFQKQLIESLRDGAGATDEVYQLTTSLFPLTTIKSSRK